MIEASCHCGAVRMEIARGPAEITDCNCSICRRLGARWAYYHPDEVRIIAAPDATGAYSWDDESLAFHHCRTCGCTTYWSALIAEKADRMGVNARLMDPAVLKGVRVRKLDGTSSWTAEFTTGE